LNECSPEIPEKHIFISPIVRTGEKLPHKKNWQRDRTAKNMKRFFIISGY
jgi:hypothetical protein